MKSCCATYLNEQFGGDEAIVAEIYGEYVASVQAKLDEAEKLLAGGEWQPLDRVAHTVKGNALAAGDGEMAQTAIDLRSAAQLQDRVLADGLVARMRTLAGQL